MSDALLITIVSAISAIVGAAVKAAVDTHGQNAHDHTDSSQLLLQAQQQLSQTMEDQQRLWQWNRELVDHIFRGAPPPPPPPPDGLFDTNK